MGGCLIDKKIAVYLVFIYRNFIRIYLFDIMMGMVDMLNRLIRSITFGIGSIRINSKNILNPLNNELG